MDGSRGQPTDPDGNVYYTVVIGFQVWTVENLCTTKYKDGNDIPRVPENNEWDSLRTGAFCYYDNDSAVYANKYGALYNKEQHLE